MYDKLERDLEKELEIDMTYVFDRDLLQVLKDYILDNYKIISSSEISELITLYHDILNGRKNKNG